MSVYESIMQGLNEAVEYQQGNISARRVKLTAKPADAFNTGDIRQIQQLKDAFHEREIVILPKDEYAEMEKARHNLAYTGEIEEGNVIVKTMAELEAMEHE